MKIVRCSKCSESFPDYLFEFGIAFRCGCGALVGAGPGRANAPAPATLGSPKRSKLGEANRQDEGAEPARPSVASTVPDLVPDLAERHRRVRELRRRADRIGYLIVSTDKPLRQIESEMRVLRDRCLRYFPEIRGAYEQVYEARFQKLWREFR